ncbi:hypothetical protein [Falsarthrobacter nasiphocae]|uniref:Uncharacterized protein n=1 Tax=Falsarthrobacter nasiphocae TaxID=189863 RepID=A0AAE3YEL9_9MICC|nr:hypothetical protein [Falsarthrobacter nasiphocae]MDR6891780.1 hypothetical protein [Falsarthrobacter nasiphocae]
MAFFAQARARRRDESELGTGLWRRAHDRYIRGLDRFHQILEQGQDEAASRLVPAADLLADALPRIRAVCVEAHRAAPGVDLNVPGGRFTEVHRRLSRAGNALAASAEAAAMTLLAPGGADDGAAGVENVERRARQVLEEIAAAEAALRDVRSQ